MALCPDDGPPRLFRFGELPQPIMAIFDPSKNLLLIDKENYDKLDETQQDRVLKTNASCLLVERNHRNVLTVVEGPVPSVLELQAAG